MQKIDIQLPPDDLIDLWDFTSLIAKSICPSLRGARNHSWMQHKLEPIPGTEFEKRSDMTAQERETVVRLLPGLPLQAGMSKEDQTMFLNAFLNHPDRPPWRPVFVSEAEVAANGFKILEIQEQHLLALNREISPGNIRAFDANHIRENRVGLNIFIAKEDALRYLEQQRLRISKETPSPQPVASGARRSLGGQQQQSGEHAPRPPSHSSGGSEPVHSQASAKPVKAPRPATAESDTRVPVIMLRRRQVEARTSLSRSAIYDRLDPHSPRYDATFPKQVKLGSASVGWLESEIEAWLNSRPKASRQ